MRPRSFFRALEQKKIHGVEGVPQTSSNRRRHEILYLGPAPSNHQRSPHTRVQKRTVGQPPGGYPEVYKILAVPFRYRISSLVRARIVETRGLHDQKYRREPTAVLSTAWRKIIWCLTLSRYSASDARSRLWSFDEGFPYSSPQRKSLSCW